MYNKYTHVDGLTEGSRVNYNRSWAYIQNKDISSLQKVCLDAKHHNLK